MKPRALFARSAPLRRQAKAGLSKVLLTVASGRKRVTAVKTGLLFGGGDHGTLTKSWRSWDDSPSSRWKNHKGSDKIGWQEGSEEVGTEEISSAELKN